METHNVTERNSGRWSHGGGDTWKELRSMEGHSHCQRWERSTGKGQVRNSNPTVKCSWKLEDKGAQMMGSKKREWVSWVSSRVKKGQQWA